MSEEMKKIMHALVFFLTMCAISATIGLLVAAEVLLLNGTCAEDSSIEMIQLLFLIASGALILSAAKTNISLRGGLTLCGGFFLCMAIRETDAWTDSIYKGAWLPFALADAFICMFIAYRNRDTIVAGLAEICDTKNFAVLATGLAFVMVFSRIFGNKQIWGFVYSEVSVRTIKNVAEESLELFGDTLILTWSILSLKKLRKAK